MFFVALLIYAAVFLASQFLRGKPQQEQQKPADLGDFNVPTATEDRRIPLIWGTVLLEGPNVTWDGDFRQVPINQRVRTGLFSSQTVLRGYKYYLGIQMSLCRGPIDSLRRILVGDKEVYTTPVTTDGDITIDQPTLFGGDDLGSGGISGTVGFYRGTLSQAVDPYLAGFQSPSTAYRGTCLGILKGMYIGNSTSLQPWKWEVRRIPNGLGLVTPSVNSGNDANPMNVIYEVLTDNDWGLGYPSGSINTTSFTNAATTLLNEGNGFSWVCDTPMRARDIINLIQEQIDGVVYRNPTSGQWEVSLARGGYSVGALTQLDDSNVVEIRDYAPGSWAETVNQVRVSFADRAKEYKIVPAVVQDLANLQVQLGVNVTASIKMPGCKDATLANALATRELLGRSFPLKKATLLVNRELYNVVPGQVLAWTNAELGLVQFPVRVLSVNYGDRREGTIELSVIQDVFDAEDGLFADPPASGWEAPADTVVAVPTNDQAVFEAPLAFCRRDPEQPDVIDRVWAGARYQSDNAAAFKILMRSSSGTPSGAFTEAGDVYGFMPIGKLQSNLSAGTTQGSTTIVLLPDPDTVVALKAVLTQSATNAEIGGSLVNIFKIGNELLSLTSYTDGGSTLTLSGCYRGMCDTAPANHSANDLVYLLIGAMSSLSVTRGYNVHVKLQPRSRTDTLAEGSATQISLTMADRARRPYPPVELTMTSVRYPTGTVSLDSGGGGVDTRGITQGWRRRDYRTFDEVVGLSSDAASVNLDFPAATTTEHAVEVRNDPNGTNTLLYTTAWAAGNSVLLSRTEILRYTSAVVPTRLRVTVKTRHTYEGQVLESSQQPVWDFDVASSALAGLFSMGTKIANAVTAAYTAPTSGTYNCSIGTAMGGGNIEGRINGGAWSTVIAGGATSGTLSGVTASDTLEFRNTWSGPGTGQTLFQVDAPSSSSDAFGVFVQ